MGLRLDGRGPVPAAPSKSANARSRASNVGVPRRPYLYRVRPPCISATLSKRTVEAWTTGGLAKGPQRSFSRPRRASRVAGRSEGVFFPAPGIFAQILACDVVGGRPRVAPA